MIRSFDLSPLIGSNSRHLSRAGPRRPWETTAATATSTGTAAPVSPSRRASFGRRLSRLQLLARRWAADRRSLSSPDQPRV